MSDIINFEMFNDDDDLFANLFEEMDVPDFINEVIEQEQAPPVAEAPPVQVLLPATTKNPTFLNITDHQKENFVSNMRNPNTVKKTETTTKQFKRWMKQSPQQDEREISDIMPQELDNLIGSFLLAIRKSDGTEYEPDTLTSYHRGIDRYLREKKYPYSKVTDKEFQTSRQVLASKRKELKGKGKGNRPNAAEPLRVEEREILHRNGVIGTETPKQLLNLIWLNNTVLFGLRGGNENRQLRWGDIELKKNDSGREYIQYNERLTKTRTGEKTTDIRAFHPKQFAHIGSSEKCPVNAYKQYAAHRPETMCDPDAPFYLSINYKRQPGSSNWYKSQPLGEHTLRSIMKSMASDGGLQGKKNNHSARKTTCTELLHNGIAPTTIQQLCGHKNVQSINNYANASLQMQEQMSDILSHNPNPPPINVSLSNTQNNSVQLTSNTATACQDMSKGMSILQNARLMNCPITIIHKIVKTGDNPPPTAAKRRRICPVISSDSDSD